MTTTATPPAYAELFTSLAVLDWNDLTAVSAAATGLLERLDSDRALLGQLAAQITENPALVGLCEHYDILDKLVLHDDVCTSSSMVTSTGPTTIDGPTPAASFPALIRTRSTASITTSLTRSM